MLLQKFSSIIDRSPIGRAVEYRKRLIERTDPNRIFVENIRSFFGINYGLAHWLCEEAVRQGAFEKRIGYLCGTCEAMIGDFSPLETPPKELVCTSCEALGEHKSAFSPTECRTMQFYKVIRNG